MESLGRHNQRTAPASDIEDLTFDDYTPFYRKLTVYFSPEKLTELAALLAQAEEKTTENSPERARVAFLQAGLKFASTQAEFFRKYHSTAKKKELKEYVEKYVKDLEAQYRKNPFAFNYPNLTLKQWPLWRDCGW